MIAPNLSAFVVEGKTAQPHSCQHVEDEEDMKIPRCPWEAAGPFPSCRLVVADEAFGDGAGGQDKMDASKLSRMQTWVPEDSRASMVS